MRKAIIITLAAAMFFAGGVSFAVENTFMDMRSRIFDESKAIKGIFNDNKDIVIVSSMWDTCMVSISQLDAYFYMVQIFNTIASPNVTKVAVESLIGWLKEIRKTNELSVSLLNNPTVQVEPSTMIRMENLKRLLTDLNIRIDKELNMLGTLSALKRK